MPVNPSNQPFIYRLNGNMNNPVQAFVEMETQLDVKLGGHLFPEALPSDYLNRAREMPKQLRRLSRVAVVMATYTTLEMPALGEWLTHPSSDLWYADEKLVPIQEAWKDVRTPNVPRQRLERVLGAAGSQHIDKELSGYQEAVGKLLAMS